MFYSRAKRGPKPQYINPARYMSRALQTQETQDRQPPMEIKNNFADFGLDSRIMDNIYDHGYTIPTPIQDQGIPVIMSGRDLVGVANTGTGKTAVFLLPLIQKVIKNSQEKVLIIVPTRELAAQIPDEFKIFSRSLNIGMALILGGLSPIPQVDALRRNPNFVIGTPGRLKDLLERNSFNPSNFSNIVLDEVDRMLDIGFVHDIKLLISRLSSPRHSYFFSATMTPDVEVIMKSFLKDPVTISVKTQETQAQIQQDIVKLLPGQNKMQVLHDLLRKPGFEKVIVFGRTKHGINKLDQVLSEKGLRVSSIHGNKSQNARQTALSHFKSGRTQALLATDIAARGIDIPDVTHVINYDEPGSFEDYTHRIGRTGRAGKVGKALTFVG